MVVGGLDIGGPDERFAFAAGRDGSDVGHLRDLRVAPHHRAGSMRVTDRRSQGGVARVPRSQERHERDH